MQSPHTSGPPLPFIPPPSIPGFYYPAQSSFYSVPLKPDPDYPRYQPQHQRASCNSICELFRLLFDIFIVCIYNCIVAKTLSVVLVQ